MSIVGTVNTIDADEIWVVGVAVNAYRVHPTTTSLTTKIVERNHRLCNIYQYEYRSQQEDKPPKWEAHEEKSIKIHG